MILGGIIVVSWLAWMFTVVVMRYRHAGKVCAGDYDEAFSRWSFDTAQKPYLNEEATWLSYSFFGQIGFILTMFSGFTLILVN